MQRKFHVFLLLSLLLLTFIIGGCNDLQKAEKKVLNTDYPEHPINMIVPFSAGGGTDLQARTLEKMFPKYFKQNLLVLNKPGAGGTIGWNELVTSEPDGYTLGITATELLMQPFFGETKYHYPTALEPLAQFSSTPFLLVVNSNQTWNSLDDLMQYAKQNPKKLKFGHGGIGSVNHALAEIFFYSTAIDGETIPFQGAGEVTSALLGDHIQAAFLPPAVIKEQLKVGKLKVLVSTGERVSSDPDFTQVPTFHDLGFDDMTLSIWYGIAAPKELPESIKEKLTPVLKQMIYDPEFKANIENLGMEVDYLNSEQSKEKWVRELDRLDKMIKNTGIDKQIQAQKK